MSGLIALRFFVGILGGTFVPCQVWSTGFFDKNVVGTSNALIGGWGNSGGGITYFLMPLIYDSLKADQGLTSHQAWRVAFIVPFILIVTTAVGMFFLCEDTPTGKWSERHQATQALLHAHVDSTPNASPPPEKSNTLTPAGSDMEKGDKSPERKQSNVDIGRGTITIIPDEEAHLSKDEMRAVAQGEVVVAPTGKEMLHVIFSLQTAFHCAVYICSFGGELAINSYIAAYYLKNFPYLGQTGAGRWASMFGLLNVVTRPLGGIVSDLLYKHVTTNLWLKKAWIVSVGIISGAFLIAIGLLDPRTESTMFGLIAGMAFFLEAGNGASFALVPHVHPHANGVVSGTVGAMGNFGGVIFAILFRFHGTNYAESFWIMGIMIICFNLVLAWVPPIPKGQVGGR